MGPSEEARRLLAALQQSHAAWLREEAWACKSGCAACCTRSVHITGLEGREILRYLREAGRSLEQVEAFQEAAAARPQNGPLTTNHFARLCLAGLEPPAEPESPWDFQPCPFLTEDLCSIYPVRPMMCRAFVSKRTCQEAGTAEVPPLVLTTNTLFLQLVEHLAAGEAWGNMLTILASLQDPEYGDVGLSRAEEIPGFLIPPEEEEAVAALWKGLAEARVGDKSLLGSILRERG